MGAKTILGIEIPNMAVLITTWSNHELWLRAAMRPIISPKLTAINMASAPSFKVGPIPSLMTSLTVRWATLKLGPRSSWASPPK